MDKEVVGILDEYNNQHTKHSSIRSINFFVVNYSRDNFVLLKNNKILYHEYLIHLKHYKRKGFDPFRRGEKLFFQSVNLYSTMAQYTFFKWAKHFQVLKFIEKNYKTVHDQMIKKEVSVNQTEENRKRKKNCKQFICLHPKNDYFVRKCDANTFLYIFQFTP